MKASGIITMAGGVGALALLALSVAMRGDEPEAPARTPTSGPRAAASSPMAATGTSSRLAARPSSAPGTAPTYQGAAPPPTSALAQQAPAAGTSPSGGPQESAPQAQGGAVGTVGGAGEADTVGMVDEPGAAGALGSAGLGRGAGAASEVDKVLEVARQAPREDERINALRWLGENGTPAQFEALQEIQINDPSPEVRKSAETAVNTLRTRGATEEWPGVTPTKDPQDYMRGVTSPSP